MAAEHKPEPISGGAAKFAPFPCPTALYKSLALKSDGRLARPDLDAIAASARKDTTGAGCPGGLGDSTIPIQVSDAIVSVSADRKHWRALLSRGGRLRTGFAALPEAAGRAVATAAGQVNANNLNTFKAT